MDVPAYAPKQKKLFVVNEILSAWQYLEVYIIAIVVSLLQIGSVAGFLVRQLVRRH